MKIENFRRQIILARELIAGHLHDGDAAVDGTAGTGMDTLMMAEAVGPTGIVYSFDLQEAAIAQTAQRLVAAGVRDRVRLYQQGHETIGEISEIVSHENIKAAMFNLGYLPGGDPEITTRVETSMKAIEDTLSLMAVGGLMTVCAYPHEQGRAEIAALDEFTKRPVKGLDCYKIETCNHVGSPILYLIFKRASEPQSLGASESRNLTRGV